MAKRTEVRARYVARGFEDDSTVQSDSPTFGKDALRIFLAVIASKNWTVKSTDIKSAFLQGKPIDRDIYLIPPKEADTQAGNTWKLKRCLYGLNDAARQFYHIVTECLTSLGCEKSSIDPTFYYKW